MQVKWKAILLDVMLLLALVSMATCVIVSRSQHHKLAPVIYHDPGDGGLEEHTDPGIVSKPVSPVQPVSPVAEKPVPAEKAVKPKAVVRQVPPRPRFDCSKVVTYTKQYSKQDIETYGAQYGLTTAQIRAVTGCMK
jgi:hypothetical protein